MWGFARRSARALEVTPKHEELFRDACIRRACESVQSVSLWASRKFVQAPERIPGNCQKFARGALPAVRAAGVRW